MTKLFSFLGKNWEEYTNAPVSLITLVLRVKFRVGKHENGFDKKTTTATSMMLVAVVVEVKVKAEIF